MKKLYVFLLFLFYCCPVSVFAGEVGLGDWTSRVEVATAWETGQKPKFFFQTVQPLSQKLDRSDTLFIQPRISMRDGESTFNLGLGRRALVSENCLLGFHVFGDYKRPNDHGRIGVGAEVIGQRVEARINSYLGVTPTRRVASNNTTDTYERVADGYDMEIGSAVPFFPWMKVYGSIFEYDYKKSKNRKGWKFRSEVKVNDAITLEGYVFDDNKGDQEYGVEVRFKLFFDGLFDFSDSFKSSEVAFPQRDLRDEMLKPVKRNHDVVVEKWIEDKAGTVVIRIGRAS